MDTAKTPDTQGKIDLECLWMEHFAYALHKNGILNDDQYRNCLIGYIKRFSERKRQARKIQRS